MTITPKNNLHGFWAAGLFMICLLSSNLFLSVAQAQKAPDPKAKAAPVAPSPAEQAAKQVSTISDQLIKLQMAIEGGHLLSPDEAGQLVSLKYQLQDMLMQSPATPQLDKCLYIAAMLFTEREAYDNAYELYGNLSESFPSTPYGLRAKAQMQRLEKKYGADTFAAYIPLTPAAPATAASAPGK